MNNGFKAEWEKHQGDFLGLMLKELELVDNDFKVKLEALMLDYKPREASRCDRLKSFLRMTKPTQVDQSKLAHFSRLQSICDELYGSKGRKTYAFELESFIKGCHDKISCGKTISIFLGDLEEAEKDPRKSKRLMDHFDKLKIGTLKEQVIDKLCLFNARQSFECEAIAGIWKIKLDSYKPVDPFQGFNETEGFAALNKLFADAGQKTTIVTAGSGCSHAGVLDKHLTLDDSIPCFTTTYSSKVLNYARPEISRHVNEPTEGKTPKIIRGKTKIDLCCGEMHGTSFDEFTKTFCNTTHAHLKAWIASWCADRGLDGLVGTNGGADEFVVIKPSNVAWTLWITLPETLAAFDKKYGNPPSLAHVQPTLAPQRQAPPPSPPSP